MSRKQTVAILIVVVAVLGAAAVYLYQAKAPTVQDEIGTVDGWLSDLDDYLGFENQPFDDNMGGIAGDWG